MSEDVRFEAWAEVCPLAQPARSGVDKLMSEDVRFEAWAEVRPLAQPARSRADKLRPEDVRFEAWVEACPNGQRIVRSITQILKIMVLLPGVIRYNIFKG